MHKKKTSKKRDLCFEDMPVAEVKSGVQLHPFHPEKVFKDHKKIATALFDCLLENDTEAFVEILGSYIHVNQRRLAKKARMARSTVHQALSGKGNPTLKTLAKIVHEACGST